MAITKKKVDTKVKVHLYNEWIVYPNLGVAKAKMLDAMRNSDGAEKERYTRVYLKLMEGKKVVTDEDN